MNNIEEIKRDENIENHNDWEKGGKRRTYLTLTGHRNDMRGCATWKIYIDHDDNNVIKVYKGKGTTPRAWDESLDNIEDTYETERI